MIKTLRDITDIKEAEEQLRKSHEELEAYSTSLKEMVRERTKDLEESRGELKRYSQSLEKANEALKIIIQGIEEQKKEVENRVTHNLNLTIKPVLEHLKVQEASDVVGFLLRSLDFNLANMFSSFGTSLVESGQTMTPREIRICEMIRSGLTSKQIAAIVGISPQTVLVHRKNIRRKLGLAKTRKNLVSYLRANL
jgi:DNA-binding CsgD family transcriptional regulator